VLTVRARCGERPTHKPSATQHRRRGLPLRTALRSERHSQRATAGTKLAIVIVIVIAIVIVMVIGAVNVSIVIVVVSVIAIANVIAIVIVCVIAIGLAIGIGADIVAIGSLPFVRW